jgi:hypothetical protein
MRASIFRVDVIAPAADATEAQRFICLKSFMSLQPSDVRISAQRPGGDMTARCRRVYPADVNSFSISSMSGLVSTALRNSAKSPRTTASHGFPSDDTSF